MKTAIRVGRAILMISGALLLVVLFTPAVSWGARLVTTRWTDADRGVLIVLSGTTVSSPDSSLIIGLNTYWRAIHAIAVWRTGHFRTLLISGSGTAETVKPLLISAGIPDSAILVENRSTNTHENALFCKPILTGLTGPYVLLTSDYHSFRAARCFAHEKIAVETMPAPDLLKRCQFWWQRWDSFCQLMTEFAAIVYYQARGWI